MGRCMSITIHTINEIDPLLDKVRAAATRTANALATLMISGLDGLEVLRQMKFTEMAWHPIDDRQLNLVEQINQTWTCLVSLKALPFLFNRHPEAHGFRLNLSTAAGTDIESLEQNIVAAETFAVHPSNNRKLAKGLQKLARTCPDAKARYVFLGSPGSKHERQVKLESIADIEVWAVDV
jgi:hypothetical protein